jgi:carbohydrate-selective porin OprB
VSLHAQTRYGKDISADAGAFVLPNTALLFPLPGDYSGTDVTGLLVEQAFFDGQVDVFFGKLNVLDLWTGFYPHVGYGLESFLNINALASGWPFLRHINLSMWGGGIWKNTPDNQIEGGFIFYGQENVATTWSFDGSFDDGVGMLGFWRFFWDLGGKPGIFLVAGLGATKEYASLDPTDWDFIPGEGLVDSETGRPWGFASYLYQEFWHGSGDKGRKAYLYMGGGMADENPSFARWNIFASVEAIGLLPMREADRMGFAGWYNQVNKDLKNLIGSLPTNPRVGNSWGFELYYNFAINKWLHLTADLQLTQNANKDDNFAVIPGGRLVLDF